MARSTSRALTRGGLALALSCAVAAPFLGPAAAAGAASAPTPYDVVIPPVNAPRLMDERVGFAGSTGYERITPGSTATWNPYDGGAPTEISTAPQFGIRTPDGTEWLANQPNDTTMRLYDPGSGATADVTLPGHGLVVAAATGTSDGWAMLAIARTGSSTAGYVYTYHLLAVHGTTVVTDTTLTGIPQDIQITGWTQTAESGGRMIAPYDVPGGGRDLALVDPVTGAADTVQGLLPKNHTHQLLTTADSVGWYEAGTIHMVPLDDPHAAPRTTTLPAELHAAATTYRIALTGDTALALASVGSGWNDGQITPLYSVPLTGGPATELLPDASGMAASWDGGVTVRSGAEGAAWDAYRIRPGGGAPAKLFGIRELSPVRYGLSLAQGRLRFLEGMPDTTDRFTSGALYYQSEGVGPVPQPVSAPHLAGIPIPDPVSSCDARHHCTAGLVDGGSYGDVAYVARAANGKDSVYAANKAFPGGVPLDSTGGRIIDASENYVLYNSGSNGKQYVIDIGYGTVVLTRPIAAAALWGDTLWTASTTKGKVDQLDLRSRYTSGPVARTAVTTDAPCAIKEVQALDNWLYWSCGANGPAGVYDRTARKSVAVPAGSALLGDGFVLRHPGGELQVTDSRTGATRTVAALPADPSLPGGDRGVTWTVDKFRGQIAYTAPDATTHLIPSGTAPSPLDAQNVLDIDPWFYARFGWEISELLSGPAASWKLEFRPKTGGAAVRTISGGATTARIETSWDGKDGAGRYVPTGSYVWTLTATPANGLGADLVRTGTVAVHRSLALPHDYSDDGVGDLLGMTPAGRLDVRQGSGTGAGTVLAAGSAQQSHGWPTTSRYVPINDLSGRGVNSLLVRSAAGVLTRYTADVAIGYITPTSSQLTIGGGWNIYDTLTSPGDLTGDGRPDLVARDAAGRLWRYDGTSTGTLASRVLICGGWQGYNLIIGAQDLDHDGTADLLARDSAGVLWRYDGDGKGGVRDRVRIGGGWQGYNALAVVGDLGHDGTADLLARDSAGVLWRYDGDGKGSFVTPRASLGAGWMMYSTLL
ncbi:FG-GAP-like repeat-containing protein [Streptomyces sp. NPDC049040]|uniref:FG-GAP-like repeat-containing protein n=1 Tax=Streptomyces sp. NPDC049040 TaxID=3365593 RepID=UPI00371799FC